MLARRFVTAMLVGSTLAVSALSQPSLSLVAQAELPAGVVKLGQVADVQGAGEMTERLKAMPIARLDANAPELSLQRIEIERLVLRSLGRDAACLHWSGTRAVRLRAHREARGPMAVTRYDNVTASTTEGLVRVEQPAIALANGRAGDVIGARLPNGVIVRAQVRGPGKLAL